MSASPEYRAYSGARSRCCNPRDPAYRLYGGRGLKFTYKSFEQFLADVGYRPSPRYTLDRINNNKGYGPGQCRWGPHRDNLANRRNTRWATAFGKTRPLAEWSRETGISIGVLGHRIGKLKWSPARALSTPVGRPITVGGKTVKQHARELDLHPTAIWNRIDRGWSVERAISTPSLKRAA